MPEPTTTQEPTASTEPTVTQGDPADPKLGENGEKALKAERSRASSAEKERDALKAELDKIAAANLSDLEKAQKAAADAQAAVTQAQAEALRFRIAAKHSISDDDAELFLTGTDEETLTRQAARLVERTPTSSTPKPDLSQGGKPAAGSTPEGDFASFMAGQLS